MKKETVREIAGKISHWGMVGKRSHILTAKIPDDFKLGEVFLVRVLSVPDCKDCKKEN